MAMLVYQRVYFFIAGHDFRKNAMIQDESGQRPLGEWMAKKFPPQGEIAGCLVQDRPPIVIEMEL